MIIDPAPFMCRDGRLSGRMLPNTSCKVCGYVCRWSQTTMKGAVMKHIFIEINKKKIEMLRANWESGSVVITKNGNMIITATGDSISSCLQKLNLARLYTHVRFDYAYARQYNHRQYYSGLEYRFGADFETLKKDLQNERYYNFTLIEPDARTIEWEKNEVFWKMSCPKCSSKSGQLLYNHNGEYDIQLGDYCDKDEEEEAYDNDRYEQHERAYREYLESLKREREEYDEIMAEIYISMARMFNA